MWNRQKHRKLNPFPNLTLPYVFQGEKIVIKAEYSDTILSLKQKIHELSGITLQEQLLVFKGRKLNNNQSLQHYRIQPDSLICLNLVRPSESHFIIKQTEDLLLDSVVSLTRKTSTSSRTTRFRSESISQRKYKHFGPFDVEFKSKRPDIHQPYIILTNKQYQLKNSLTFNQKANQFSPYNCPEVYSQSVDSQLNTIGLKPPKIEAEFQFEQI